MAEWFYEQGIGENRAILVEGDAILEAAIELPGEMRAGTVADARLTSILVPGRRAIVTIGSSVEALLEPLPARLTEGQIVRVEIVREAIPEAGRAKLARCRASDATPCEGPALLERLQASGHGIADAAFATDRFEESGWSEVLEQASEGEIGFAGGALRMSLTPALTLFDVDGDLAPAALAIAGAQAAARAIRLLGIGGSIGIDLPTLASRADRQAAAAAFDAVMPHPFERTAVNGFGFLQVVRRLERPSLPELIQMDRVGAAARALLRRAERAPGAGPLEIQAAPLVAARLEASPFWLADLARRAGANVELRVDAGRSLAGGHVQRRTA